MKFKKIVSISLAFVMAVGVACQGVPLIAQADDSTIQGEADAFIEKLNEVVVTSSSQLTSLEALKDEYVALDNEVKELVTNERYEKLLEDIDLATLLAGGGSDVIVKDQSSNRYDLDLGAAPNASFINDNTEGIALLGYFDVNNTGAADTFNSIIGGTHPFTFEAYINPNGVGTGGNDYNMIMSKGDNSAAFRVSENTVYFFIKNSANDWIIAQSKTFTNNELNEWHHVAGIYDGNDISVYMDGALTTTASAGTVASSSYPLSIGYCQETNRISSSSIKNVHVYSKALTLDELKNRTYSPTDQDVQLWYDFYGIEYTGISDSVSITGFREYEDNTTVEAGMSRPLSADPKPYYATGDVSYRSEDTEIAIVDEYGYVTGLAAGNTNIIATSISDSSITTTIPVNVIRSVKSITLNAASKALFINDTHQIEVTVTPADATESTDVIYTTSNASAATVDNEGLVTAVGSGSATITAALVSNPDIKATLNITVSIAVTSIELSDAAKTIKVGDTFTLTGTANPDNATNRKITYSSDRPEIASVGSSTGIVTGKAEGTATITAVSSSNPSVTATCEVMVLQTADSITLNPSTATIKVGANTTIKAFLNPSTATDTVKFASLNTTVATVDADTGMVTGVAVGEATITATAESNSSVVAECKITVVASEVPVTSIKFRNSKKIITLNIKGNVTNTAVVSPANATNQTVSYKSDNTKAATVDKNGKVTAKAAGIATITATCGGKTASYQIQVKPAKVTKLTAKSKASKKAALTWKKVNGASGYQVQIATKKSSLKNAKIKAVKNAKYNASKLVGGKNYSVRVRAYKQVGKTKVYGNWSKVTSVIIKK